MTVKEILKLYPKIDETELFLSHLLKFPKEKLYINPEQKINKNLLARFKNMVKEFGKGKPAAYILKYKYFFGLKFFVNSNVLIPRPESEWLVEKSLDFIKSSKAKSLKVLDLGTGSGCLAISISKNSPIKTIDITASDISKKALSVAQKNARSHDAKIKFIQSNLLNDIKNSYDLIIANLPYVPINDYDNLKKNLHHEPKMAITDGTNDFELYEKFLRQLSFRKNLPKLILFEMDPSTKLPLTLMVKKYLPKSKIIFYKDFNNLWRYASIQNK